MAVHVAGELPAEEPPCPTVVLHLDPDSQRWLTRLHATGPARDEAIAELLALLLVAARFVLVRRRAALASFPRETLDDLAHEAAADALVEILAHLGDYRGRSRFTTWAWKFAFYKTSETIRRRAWMGREIPTDDVGWSTFESGESPHGRLEQRELVTALADAIDGTLTPHQRRVFVALALNGVPVDVLAERLGTTRGALYKTLHEARRRLRARLEGSTAA